MDVRSLGREGAAALPPGRFRPRRGRAPGETALVRVPPRVPGLPVLGSALAFKRAPLRFLTGVAREHGRVATLKIGLRTAYVLNDPEDVRHVLVTRVATFPKTRQFKGSLKGLFGDALLTSDGESWLRQRRLTQPLFHKQRIAAFAGTFARYTDASIAEWDALARGGRPVEALAQMRRLTMRIASQALFGYEVGARVDAVGEAVESINMYVFKQGVAMVRTPSFLPTPGMLHFKWIHWRLHRFIRRLIAQRRREPGERDDLLSMLLHANAAEGGAGLSARLLEDEVMTFYLAGYETTANTLAWTLYLLAVNPEIQRAVRDEARAVLGDRPPGIEDLPRLELTTRVIEESMRLYPVAWMLTREAAEKDELGGYAIPAGAWIFVPTYTLHRSPHFWRNPERFDPDHFLPEQVQQRPRFAYLPFGGGQRQCIGAGFAMMEMQVALPMLVRAFRMELAPGARVEPDPVFTLRPTAVPLRIERA